MSKKIRIIVRREPYKVSETTYFSNVFMDSKLSSCMNHS